MMMRWMLACLVVGLAVSCGGQNTQGPPPSAPMTLLDPSSPVVAQAQTPPALTWYDVAADQVGPNVAPSTDPVIGQVRITLNGQTAQAVHVFGAAWQTAPGNPTIDPNLQVWIAIDCIYSVAPCHHLYGPVPLGDTFNFASDIIFYPTAQGVKFRVEGLGASEPYWPAPVTLYSMIDGDGPEPSTVNIYMQILGTVLPEDAVEFSNLVAK